jgi:hypothetical protein
MKKKYGDVNNYEKKLKRVMDRLEIEKYDYNWDRISSYVEFEYKGELYRFEQNKDNAQFRGIEIQYGTDCFAQLVLTLEDIARMVERGIYDLQTWVTGIKCLPSEKPFFYKVLNLPDNFTMEELEKRYKELIKKCHPDVGGSEEEFILVRRAYEYALDEIKYK